MRKIKQSLLLAGVLLLAACVTINIYFPSAEAEEAAERIVEDILGKAKSKSDEAIKGDKGTYHYLPANPGFSLQLLDLIHPLCTAAQPNFNVNTPKIRKLQASMKQRHRSLVPYYDSGAIGFDRNALVAMHDTSVVPIKVRNKVKKLISSENGDRNALYKAIANANGHPEWESDVRATFDKKWIKGAHKGWWYQDTSKRWKQR